jgi:hypothetical protein
MCHRSLNKSFLSNVITLCCLFSITIPASAKEGMWLPPTIAKREADMKAMGLQIPIDKIYNDNGTGLNNAVVLFGSGCTGEIISSKGLLLTNHHCGYGTVQGLSSKEKDYFANGFWAMNNKEELPCPGLTVTFIRKMENVSDIILKGIDDTLASGARDTLIMNRVKGLEKGYRYTTKMDASIRPFFNGNQYWVIISETFTDVRLVGFPQNGIGQFGGDTDNWMWPRHTGDFSMFRVYAGKNNKPAPYSASNKPYETKNFFTINTSGYKEGDFTMVYGFPGTTMEYISSYQLNQIYSISDPVRIDLRTKKLDVWTKHMNDSRDVFLKYTSKRAGVANAWKKWQGEMRGLRINGAVDKKREREKEFQQWALSEQTMPYADDLLTNIYAITSRADSALKAETYIQEGFLAIELMQQSAVLDRILQVMRARLPEQKIKDSVLKLAKGLEGFYKNYDVATDQDLFNNMMPVYYRNSGSWTPNPLRKTVKEYRNDFSALGSDIYNISLLADKARLDQFVNGLSVKDTMRILSDPAWRLYNTVAQYRKDQVLPVINRYNTKLTYLNRLYMKAQMQKDWNTMFYPDANLTLRMTYGKVEGMDPDGPADYSYQTNLDEVIAKDNPEVEEFRVPMKLKELYAKKDYGRWAVNGTVPVAFIASNHTSGGNSGSPVLNAKGQLIGTNFDRVWEGTMSDLYFDPKLCRNISLDIRYTLFVVEKMGGAGWLLKEMDLVKK